MILLVVHVTLTNRVWTSDLSDVDIVVNQLTESQCFEDPIRLRTVVLHRLCVSYNDCMEFDL